MEKTRHRFHEALRELEQKTLDGFELVIEQLDRALESVGSRDTELAATVVSDDDRINRRYREIHEDAPGANRRLQWLLLLPQTLGYCGRLRAGSRPLPGHV